VVADLQGVPVGRAFIHTIGVRYDDSTKNLATILSHPRTGYFHRLLSPGRYFLWASFGNKMSSKQEVIISVNKPVHELSLSLWFHDDHQGAPIPNTGLDYYFVDNSTHPKPDDSEDHSTPLAQPPRDPIQLVFMGTVALVLASILVGLICLHIFKYKTMPYILVSTEETDDSKDMPDDTAVVGDEEPKENGVSDFALRPLTREETDDAEVIMGHKQKKKKKTKKRKKKTKDKTRATEKEACDENEKENAKDSEKGGTEPLVDDEGGGVGSGE